MGPSPKHDHVEPSHMDVQEDNVSPSELLNEIKDASNAAPAEANENWYAISAKWLKQLISYLEAGATNATSNPGAIDNTELIVREDGVNYLKDDLAEKADFEFVPEKLWLKLVQEYSTASDLEAQRIMLKSYENSLQFDSVPKVELRPLVVQCALYPDVNKPLRARVSRASTIEECVHMLMRKFNLKNFSDLRFWLFTPTDDLELAPGTMDSSINVLDLTIKHMLIIEERTKSSWELDNEEALKELRNDLIQSRDRVDTSHSDELTDDRSNRYNLRSSLNSSQGGSSATGSGYGSESDVGLLGLGNLGNTCFMNSSIQCMSNIPELTRYFLNGDYKGDLNPENPLGKGGNIAKGYAELLQSLWSKESHSAVYPSRFKSTEEGIAIFDNLVVESSDHRPNLLLMPLRHRLGSGNETNINFSSLLDQDLVHFFLLTIYSPHKASLSRYSSIFNGTQQDSQESLQFIVDCLHEDLNRVREKPYREAQDDEVDGKGDKERAKEAWALYLERNDSVVVDLFYGQIRSTVKCPTCTKTSVTFDPVCYYSLPLPTTQVKRMAFTFVPYGVIHAKSKHKVSVPKTGTISDFLAKVSDTLIAADVHEFRLTLLKPSTSLDDYGDRNRISVYQLEFPLDDVRYGPVFVYIRKIRRAYKDLYDDPFVINVPARGIKAKTLYQMVYRKLIRKIELQSDFGGSAEVVDIDDSEMDGGDQQVSNGVIKVEDSTEEVESPGEGEVAAWRFYPNFLTISTVNSLGTTNIASIEPNLQQLVKFSLGEDHFLAVDFTEENCEKFYKKTPETPYEIERNAQYGKSNETVQLIECFSLYIQPEKLGGNNMWRCPICKEEKQAIKKLDFWKMPKYMFVHLKRFQYNRFYREKLNTKVHFPVEKLDLSGLVLNSEERPAVYDLIAVSCHAGGLGGGHYWAVCQNVKDKKWYKFDDSNVKETDVKEVQNETAPYILVFKRRGSVLHLYPGSLQASTKTEDPMDTST